MVERKKSSPVSATGGEGLPAPVKKKRKPSSKKNDKITLLNKIISAFTSRKGIIFLTFIVMLSIMEYLFKVESTALKLIKSIIEVVLIAS